MADPVALTAVAAVSYGLDPTADEVDAFVDGNTFLNTGNEVLIVRNDGAAPRTVTIATPATVGGLAIASRTVSVPAGESRFIGPLNPGVYNDGDDLVTVTYDAVEETAVQTVFVNLLSVTKNFN